MTTIIPAELQLLPANVGADAEERRSQLAFFPRKHLFSSADVVIAQNHVWIPVGEGVSDEFAAARLFRFDYFD